jgi:hypothetical protein
LVEAFGSLKFGGRPDRLPPPKYEAPDIDPRQLDREAAEDLKRFQGRK